MITLVRQHLDFAATHQHAPTEVSRLHGHNFRLAATVSVPSDVVMPAGTLLARLAELRPASVGIDSVRNLWASMQTGWPIAVAPQAITLTETSGAGRSIEHGQPVYINPGYFSAAHRTHAPRLSEAENQALYGICDNPAGHGHNYRVTLGHPTLAAVPASVWAEFDHRNLSVDLPDLRGRNVVTEAVAELLARRVPGAERVRVWETDSFYAEFKPATGAYYLGRRFLFSAAHRLGEPAASLTENATLYGPCALSGVHGHDFAVEIVVHAPALDPVTETAFDLGLVDQAAARIIGPLHETDLDNSGAMAGQPSTPERLASWLWDRFSAELGEALWAVGVSATPDRTAWQLRGN
jgi:6-pyruvoyltetrahydropterin/6-carboxytetrahydropterin synthase